MKGLKLLSDLILVEAVDAGVNTATPLSLWQPWRNTHG